MNCARLSGQRTGVGRYIEYLLKHWSSMLRPEEEVHAYLREPLPPESRSYLALGSRISLDLVGPKLHAFPWENSTMAFRARRDDVLFGPSYTLPFLRVPRKRVVATHSFYEDASLSYRLTYRKWHQHSARTADAVIVPCDSAADLVAAYYRIPRKRLFVVPQGAPTSFRPLEDHDLARQTRIEYLGEDVPYILFVGKLSVRRNIPLLIAAFAKARKARGLPHKLLLVGPNHVDLPLAEVCHAHGVTHEVVQTDGKFTNHEDLIRVYNAADLFVQPAEYEAWSITIVEAFACGTPVVASDRGGLRDLARGYACMVEEPTVETIAAAIGEVLSDDSLRQDLKRRGRERGRALTWELTAGETLEVVRQVARS